MGIMTNVQKYEEMLTEMHLKTELYYRRQHWRY